MAQCEFITGFGAVIPAQRFLEVFPMTPKDEQDYIWETTEYLWDLTSPEGITYLVRPDNSIFVTTPGFQRGDEGEVVELDQTKLYEGATTVAEYLKKHFPESPPRLLSYTYSF